MLTGRENLELVGRLYHLGQAERRTGQVHGIWGGLSKEERHRAAKISQGP